VGRKSWWIASVSALIWLGCAATPGNGGGTGGSGGNPAAGSGGLGGVGGSAATSGSGGGSGTAGVGGGVGGVSGTGAGSGGVGVSGTGGLGGVGGVGGGSIGDETTCNGIDDDNDGVIDDVDVGMDGVCDCLTVATLGAPGGAGQGNVFNSWLDARSAAGSVDLGTMTLTAALLAPFQVLVIQNVEGRVFSADEIQALQTWVRAGGGLMTLIGYSGANEANSVNTLLAPFDVRYGTQDVMQATCTPSPIPFVCGARESKPVTEWRVHPIAMGVTQVGMDNGKPVLGSGTVVATGEGFDLAMAVEADAGKVFVWGDEWITFDSDWSGRPEFQLELFWANALKWLTPITTCQVPPPPPPE